MIQKKFKQKMIDEEPVNEFILTGVYMEWKLKESIHI